MDEEINDINDMEEDEHIHYSIYDFNTPEGNEIKQAIIDGDIGQFMRLVSQCQNINSLRDGYGKTLAFIAVDGNNTEMLRILLERGVECDAIDIYGETALLWAVAGGHFECTKILLEFGADPAKEFVDDDTGKTYTPLSIATRNADNELIKLLEESIFVVKEPDL